MDARYTTAVCGVGAQAPAISRWPFIITTQEKSQDIMATQLADCVRGIGYNFPD